MPCFLLCLMLSTCFIQTLGDNKQKLTWIINHSVPSHHAIGIRNLNRFPVSGIHAYFVIYFHANLKQETVCLLILLTTETMQLYTVRSLKKYKFGGHHCQACPKSYSPVNPERWRGRSIGGLAYDINISLKQFIKGNKLINWFHLEAFWTTCS